MGSKSLIETLKERFVIGTDDVSCDGENFILVIKREKLIPLLRFLKEESSAHTLLLDLTCVDLGQDPVSFEMIYHVYSLKENSRLRIKTRLPAGDLSVDSLTGLWKNADWLEREVYDMFGVFFKGHPDLKRILMYDGFEGHPLRKDYPWRRRQPRKDEGSEGK